MNAPDPPCLTLISRFVVFCGIGVLLGSFRRRTKHGSKWAELVQSVQKIMPQSCVGIFRKEHTRSTPLDPKLMFWCVSYCLGAFWTVLSLTKLDSKWAKLVLLMQKFVPRNRVRTFHKERSWSTPLDSKLMFWCVLLCLGAFGMVSTPYKTRFTTGRTGAINAKVRAANSHRNFS